MRSFRVQVLGQDEGVFALDYIEAALARGEFADGQFVDVASGEVLFAADLARSTPPAVDPASGGLEGKAPVENMPYRPILALPIYAVTPHAKSSRKSTGRRPRIVSESNLPKVDTPPTIRPAWESTKKPEQHVADSRAAAIQQATLKAIKQEHENTQEKGFYAGIPDLPAKSEQHFAVGVKGVSANVNAILNQEGSSSHGFAIATAFFCWPIGLYSGFRCRQEDVRNGRGPAFGNGVMLISVLVALASVVYVAWTRFA